jgi:hypothetical protein
LLSRFCGLDQLLLLEEALEMVQLPCACRPEDNKLKNRPSHNPRIRRLGLITELCLPFLQVNPGPTTKVIVKRDWGNGGLEYPLENLFPPNILQTRIQLLHPLRKRILLVLIPPIQLTRLPHREI